MLQSTNFIRGLKCAINNHSIREFSVSSSCCCHKRNFRKFQLPNKRGFNAFKMSQLKLGMVDHRGLRFQGMPVRGSIFFRTIPEMIPEIIVPDLTDFKLKPYVSYRSVKISQSEFTAEDLFNAVYSKKMVEDFKSGKLDEEGNPLEPSEEELLTPEEAKIRARTTGSDIF